MHFTLQPRTQIYIANLFLSNQSNTASKQDLTVSCKVRMDKYYQQAEKLGFEWRKLGLYSSVKSMRSLCTTLTDAQQPVRHRLMSDIKMCSR